MFRCKVSDPKKTASGHIPLAVKFCDEDQRLLLVLLLFAEGRFFLNGTLGLAVKVFFLELRIRVQFRHALFASGGPQGSAGRS